MAIPMLKIRRPTGRLIFNMGIPIPGKTVFLIETGPRFRYILSYWNIKFTCSLYNVIMNICIFLIKYAWILNLGQVRFPYRYIQSVNISRSETGIFRAIIGNTILWLLMSWLLVSPGIRQPYYWQRRVKKSLPPRRRISTTCDISVLRSQSKYKCTVMFDKKKKINRQVLRIHMCYLIWPQVH